MKYYFFILLFSLLFYSFVLQLLSLLLVRSLNNVVRCSITCWISWRSLCLCLFCYLFFCVYNIYIFIWILLYVRILFIYLFLYILCISYFLLFYLLTLYYFLLRSFSFSSLFLCVNSYSCFQHPIFIVLILGCLEICFYHYRWCSQSHSLYLFNGYAKFVFIVVFYIFYRCLLDEGVFYSYNILVCFL